MFDAFTKNCTRNYTVAYTISHVKAQMREAISISLIQHFEADFLWKVWKVSLIILKTFTHASFQSQRLFMHAFLLSADFFPPKLTFSKSSGTLSVSNGLDLDQNQHVVIQVQNICDKF